MCAIYYPIREVGDARDARLVVRDEARQLLAKLSSEETAGWRGVYEVPSDCMRATALRPHSKQEMPELVDG